MRIGYNFYMITLKNLQHIYISKKGNKVVALKKVSYTFSDYGMYFLVGKSGSGKSTLLNLLSGIDKLQHGEIIIDGEEMSTYSETDYNNHRNNYAGIIFQEFNLIESMTVFENIDMALKLQGKADNSGVIASCLEKVGLNGYQNRFPAELSGGERQRVTIARQLAKGSKVILADEPTGSLDSENAKNVFEIFKALSKEVLIIVASHDLEFAETYGDEILTFVDGELVNTQNKNSIPVSSPIQRQPKVNEKFPVKYAFHFAFRDILNKKLRFLIACLLCFVSLAMFGMFVNISNYTSETAIAHTLVNKGDKTISAGVGYYDESGLFNTTVSFSNLFNKTQLNHIYETYPESDFIRFASMSNRFNVKTTKKGDSFSEAGLSSNDLVAIIEDERDIAFYGFSLASGSLPLTDDSVYITDYYASVIIWAEYNYLVDGVCIPIAEDESVDFLIGKTIVKDDTSNTTLKIAGIINTDPTEEGYLKNPLYTSLFATKNYFASQRDRISVSNNGTNVFNLKINYKDTAIGVVASNRVIQKTNNESNNTAILYKNSYTTDLQSVQLSKNQIILSLDAYNEMLNDNRTQDYYCSFDEDDGSIQVLKYPQFLGSKVRIEIFDETNTVLVDTLPELEVVGVFVGRLAQPGRVIYAGDEDFSVFSQAAIQYSKIDFSVKADKAYMTDLLIDLREHYILVDNYYTEDIYNFESSFITFRQLFTLIGGILLVFSMVMFANFINISIETRKKDLGIIRAIGGSGQTIFKLFLLEGLIFAGVVSVLSLGLSAASTVVMNCILTKKMVSGCTLILFNWFNLLIIPALSFGVMISTTYFPIRKISKRSPVDIIRNS